MTGDSRQEIGHQSGFRPSRFGAIRICKKTRIGEGGGATCCWGRCAGTIFGDLRDRVAAAIGSGTSARAAAGRLGGEREHGDWLGAAVASGGSRPSPPDGRRSPLALSRKLQTDQQAWIGEWVMGECASTIKERTSIPLRRRHFVALATSAQSPISSHGSASETGRLEVDPAREASGAAS